MQEGCYSNTEPAKLQHTCDGPVNDRTILQLDCHRLIRQLHQESHKLHGWQGPMVIDAKQRCSRPTTLFLH